MKASKGRIAFNICNYTILALLTIVFVVPYMYVRSTSFSNEYVFYDVGFKLLPQKWSLDAYKFLLTYDNQMLTSVWNSVLVTVGACPCFQYVSFSTQFSMQNVPCVPASSKLHQPPRPNMASPRWDSR